MQILRTTARALAAAMLMVSVTPAHAGNKLIASGQRLAVAKSTLTVMPDREWNKMGARPGRNSESWTLDGDGLNDLTFYGGIVNDKTLFREINRKTNPLPHFSSTMLLTDIPALLERSYRIALSTPLFNVDSIVPASFAGSDGVSFTYSFTAQDGLRRKGEAVAAIIGGKLFMISFEAPVLHYFDRDISGFRALVSSAKFGL